MRVKRSNTADYVPDPNLLALRPEISGNDVNGRGEEEFRRPTPVYWQDPETIPHGAMMTWFGQQPMIDEVVEAYQEREAILNDPLPEQAAERIEKDPADWSAEVRDRAVEREADLVGITRFNADWVYDRCEAPGLPWIIMIGVGQDYEAMKHVPEQIAGAEVLRQYGRVLKAARTLAGWILEQGWQAVPVGAPTPAKFVMIPPAIECGFGELGKHGSLINRDLGASFRLSGVLTDMPLVAQKTDDFGADDFCTRCHVCEKACPVDAIEPRKQMIRGVERWYVNFDRCLPFFNEHLGCSICATVCPWSMPGVAPKLVDKIAKRSARNKSSGEGGE